MERLAKFLLRRYPFYSGYYKVLGTPLARRLSGEVTDPGPTWTRARGGIDLLVTLGDLEGRSIDLLGDWDPKISWACRKILGPGDTFVDVGANFGLESLVGARAVGPEGRVHAFEPQPQVADMLRRSAARNGFSNVIVHEVALSDRDGTMALHIPAGHSGGASLESNSGTAGTTAVPVAVRRAAGYLGESGVGPIRLLKIDVEGHEHAVLEGARPIFEECPPVAVLFESSAWHADVKDGLRSSDFPFADLPTVRFLREHNYRFYGFGRSYLRVNLYRVRGDCPHHPPVSDLLAIHEPYARELGRTLSTRESHALTPNL